MRLIITIFTLLLSFSCLAQPLSYYFNNDVKFDPTIPTPEQVLGYEVGQWHVRHDQLVRYMEILAEKSDRINFEVIGRTHEQRPLVMLTITAADKLGNVEQLRQAHLARLADSEKAKNTDQPAVVWMGYSVHGNESSGSNSALLVAYYLAAAQGKEIDTLLNNTVILLDPSLNPDGLARFANWPAFNMLSRLWIRR